MVLNPSSEGFNRRGGPAGLRRLVDHAFDCPLRRDAGRRSAGVVAASWRCGFR